MIQLILRAVSSSLQTDIRVLGRLCFKILYFVKYVIIRRSPLRWPLLVSPRSSLPVAILLIPSLRFLLILMLYPPILFLFNRISLSCQLKPSLSSRTRSLYRIAIISRPLTVYYKTSGRIIDYSVGQPLTSIAISVRSFQWLRVLNPVVLLDLY